MYWNSLVQEVNLIKTLREKRLKETPKITPKKQKIDKPGFWVIPNKPKFKPFYLTWRETQCAKYLIKQKTLKDIAQYLRLSVRTVEYYVNNVRKKSDAPSKERLVELLAQSTFTRDKPT